MVSRARDHDKQRGINSSVQNTMQSEGEVPGGLASSHSQHRLCLPAYVEGKGIKMSRLVRIKNQAFLAQRASATKGTHSNIQNNVLFKTVSSFPSMRSKKYSRANSRANEDLKSYQDHYQCTKIRGFVNQKFSLKKKSVIRNARVIPLEMKSSSSKKLSCSPHFRSDFKGFERQSFQRDFSKTTFQNSIIMDCSKEGKSSRCKNS